MLRETITRPSAAPAAVSFAEKSVTVRIGSGPRTSTSRRSGIKESQLSTEKRPGGRDCCGDQQVLRSPERRLRKISADQEKRRGKEKADSCKHSSDLSQQLCGIAICGQQLEIDNAEKKYAIQRTELRRVSGRLHI